MILHKSSGSPSKTDTQSRSSLSSLHSACTESHYVASSEIHLTGFPTDNGDNEGNFISFHRPFS